MQTAWSAKRTWSAPASASECTATASIPSSRQARMMRMAISPRLAMRIFLNMDCLRKERAPLVVRSPCPVRSSAPREIRSALLDLEELLPELDAGSVGHEHLEDGPRELRLDLVHQLHRLDDAERLPGADRLTDVRERLRLGGRRTIEGADEGRGDVGDAGVVLLGDRRRGLATRALRERRRRRDVRRGRGRAEGQAQAALLVLVLELVNAALFQGGDQILEGFEGDIHRVFFYLLVEPGLACPARAPRRERSSSLRDVALATRSPRPPAVPNQGRRKLAQSSDLVNAARLE